MYFFARLLFCLPTLLWVAASNLANGRKPEGVSAFLGHIRNTTPMSKLHTEETSALLDQNQVAEIIGCHPETVTRASRVGKLPAYYLGHRMVRYKREDVDAWLESFRHQAPPASRKRPPERHRCWLLAATSDTAN